MKVATLATLSLIMGTAIGTYLGVTAIPYVVIGAVCVISILIVRGYIKSRTYPIYIFGLALCMLWQTSMMGVHIVGTDIQIEYYVSSVAMENGWDWTLPISYNSSIVVAVIAPWISKTLSIELIWVYKAIFPVFLACVPLIMYFVFRRQLDEKRAYWASLFFMIVPVMSLELIGIAKSMIAEVFFALAILTFISNLKQLHKGVILTVLVMITLLCHYTVGLALLYFLIVALIVMLLARIWKVRGKVSLVALAIVICLSSIAGYFYFSNIGDGGIIRSVLSVAKTVTVRVPENVAGMTAAEETLYLNQQTLLVKAGIGLDFMSASTGGKVFRVVQYLTQLLIVLGLVQLWRKRKKYNFTLEFATCVFAGFILLGACIFIPYISALINMTRFYHFSLFFLAPLFVLGCEMMYNKKWTVPVVLLVYFVFTSGLVFEATQSNVFERIDMPYSLSLSYERTGIVGVFNNDDLDCVKWLVNSSNQELPIVGDVNTKRLLHGFMEEYPRLYYDTSCRFCYAWTLWCTPDNYYVFLSTWNVEHNKAVSYPDEGHVGVRELRDIPNDVYDLPIVYQSGKAIVLLKESE